MTCACCQAAKFGTGRGWLRWLFPEHHEQAVVGAEFQRQAGDAPRRWKRRCLADRSIDRIPEFGQPAPTRKAASMLRALPASSERK